MASISGCVLLFCGCGCGYLMFARCTRRRRLLKAARSGTGMDLTIRHCYTCSDIRCKCGESLADEESILQDEQGDHRSIIKQSPETSSTGTTRAEIHQPPQDQDLHVPQEDATTPKKSRENTNDDNPFAPGAYTFGPTAMENPFSAYNTDSILPVNNQ